MGHVRKPGVIYCYCYALDGYLLSISELLLGNNLQTYNDDIFLVTVQLDAQIPFNIFIYSSLHVSSMSCSSSGETDCINTASGKCHSVNKWII